MIEHNINDTLFIQLKRKIRVNNKIKIKYFHKRYRLMEG